MPLAFKHNAYNKDYTDIICEIRGCCAVLFKKQKGNREYDTFMKKMMDIIKMFRCVLNLQKEQLDSINVIMVI